MSCTRLEIEALTPTIGAEVRGVDLSQPLDDDTRKAIEQALLDHMVIFFRDQDITPEQHLAFGRYFGELRQHGGRLRETLGTDAGVFRGAQRDPRPVGPAAHRAIDRGISNANYDEVRAKWPPVEHPVVRTHPVTGRKALFVNRVTGSRFKELPDRENALLMPFLLEHVRERPSSAASAGSPTRSRSGTIAASSTAACPTTANGGSCIV
jgi:alpha-ketoglutarate-dependent taurine dioxygenase